MDAPPNPLPDPAHNGDDTGFLGLVREAARSRCQSPLYRWLDEMFDRLGPDPRRITNWQPICDAAIAAGIVGGQGQAPTPRLLADQWRRIRRRRTRTATGSVHKVQDADNAAGAVPQESRAIAVLVPEHGGSGGRLFSELACRPPTLPATADPVELTAEEKRLRGQAEADRVFGELRAASHRKYGFGRLEGEA